MPSSPISQSSDSASNDSLYPVVTTFSMVLSTSTNHRTVPSDQGPLDWREEARQCIANIKAMADATHKYVLYNLAQEKKGETKAARGKVVEEAEQEAIPKLSQTSMTPPTPTKPLDLLPPPLKPKQVLKRKANDMEEFETASAAAAEKPKRAKREKKEGAPCAAKKQKTDKNDEEKERRE